MEIPRALIDQVIEHALEEDPNECCGVISTDGLTAVSLYRITNDYASRVRYRMNPQDFLNADRDAEAKGLTLSIFYHSHTHSAPYPSDTDVRLARESGYVDSLVSYMLVSLEDRVDPKVGLYRITSAGEVIEQHFEVT